MEKKTKLKGCRFPGRMTTKEWILPVLKCSQLLSIASSVLELPVLMGCWCNLSHRTTQGALGPFHPAGTHPVGALTSAQHPAPPVPPRTCQWVVGLRALTDQFSQGTLMHTPGERPANAALPPDRSFYSALSLGLTIIDVTPSVGSVTQTQN